MDNKRNRYEEYYFKLLAQVVEKAEECGVSSCRASIVFIKTYDKHKKIHGSFALVPHPKYTKRMMERYEFMRDKAFDYILENSQRDAQPVAV